MSRLRRVDVSESGSGPDFLNHDPYAPPAYTSSKETETNLRTRSSRKDLRAQASRKDLRTQASQKDLRSQSSKKDMRGRYGIDEREMRGKASTKDLRGYAERQDSASSTGARELRPRVSRKDLKVQPSRKDVRARSSHYTVHERNDRDGQSTQDRAPRRRTRDGKSDFDSDDDEEEEDYGDFVRRWNVGMNMNEPGEEDFAIDESSGMHLRFRRPAPIHTLIPPSQIDIPIQPLVNQLLTFAKTLPAQLPSSSSELDPMGLIPSIHYPTGGYNRWIEAEETTTARPDGFVFSKYLLQGQRLDRYLSWVNEVDVYGVTAQNASGVPRQVRDDILRGWKERSGLRSPTFVLDWTKEVKMPDIFSRSHLSAAMSNGRRITITLCRSPQHNTLTQVFVSPAPAIDLEAIGAAAVEFRDRFDYLLEAFRVDTFGAGWFEPCQTGEKESSDTADPIIVIEKSSSVDLVDLYDLRVPPCRNPGATLTQSQLTQVVSSVSRALAPNSPLAPDVQERFKGFGAVFHTYEPGYTSLWEEEQSKPNEDYKAIDMGQDLEFVTAFTGAIGVSFVFDVEPSIYTLDGTLAPTGTQRPRITCQIHTSFHFWEMHRRILLRLTSLLHTAVRPAFTILEITRQGVKSSGMTLPPKPSIPIHAIPPLPVLEYNHCRLAEVRPEVIWKGFPDPQVRRMEREYMNDFDKKLLYTQAKNRLASQRSVAAMPVKEILAAVPLDTPTRPPKWQPRPLMLSPKPTESVIFSPTSTLVDTPCLRPNLRNVSGSSEVTSMMDTVPGAMPKDTLTEGGPRTLFGPGGKYAARGRSASQMGSQN